MTPLRRGDLELGRVLGKGGQGAVFQVHNLRIDRRWDAVYKEYRPPVLAAADLGALERAVQALGRFAAADAAWLRDNSAWPAGLVQDGGRVSGFLMRAVPRDFCFTPLSLSSATLNRPKPCAFEFLFNDESYMADIGLRVTDHDRLLLLAFVAGSLHRMHRLGIAVGDLSPRNLLFRTGARPACFFIDCDAMRVAGSSVLPPVETPDWELPRGEERATPCGDVYKLGLLAIRLFDRNQISSDPRALEAVSAELGRLARRSLGRDPAQRALPGEWLAALYSAAQSLPIAPVRVSPGSAYAGQTTRSAGAAARVAPRQPTPTPAPQRVGTGPGRARGSRGLRAFGAALYGATVLTGLICVGVGIDHAVRDDHQNSATASAASAASQPYQELVSAPGEDVGPSALPIPPPVVGIVQIDPSLGSDPRASQVAATLDTYFEGLNASTNSQVVYEHDLSGAVNSDNPIQPNAVEWSVSTSTDSQVDLLALTPSGTGPAATAQVAFHTIQTVAHRPFGATDETCTEWNLTYTLAQAPVVGYTILGTQSGNDSGC